MKQTDDDEKSIRKGMGLGRSHPLDEEKNCLSQRNIYHLMAL